MPDTNSRALARYLQPPRVPKTSPVVVLHVHADNTRDGNPRRCFVVVTTTGRVVETIDEGYAGEAVVWARYPWFHHTSARRLGIECAYALPVYVAPAEYKRFMRAGELDAESIHAMPDVARMLQLAQRCAKWAAVRDALMEIRRSTAVHEHREHVARLRGEPNHYADSRAQTVYHRHPADGGDAVSDHLRRAMAALVAAGMIERTDTRRCGRVFSRSVGQYVATPTTPDLY
jgi:hypothetical protein